MPLFLAYNSGRTAVQFVQYSWVYKTIRYLESAVTSIVEDIIVIKSEPISNFPDAKWGQRWMDVETEILAYNSMQPYLS